MKAFRVVGECVTKAFLKTEVGNRALSGYSTVFLLALLRCIVQTDKGNI